MLAPDPSSTARSQTVSPAPSTAAQAASAAPPTLTKSAPASLPSNFSQQPISSSVQGTARFPESNQASSVPLTSPAPTPTLTPAPTPTAFPIPQSPLSDSNSIPITGPQTGNQPASPPSSDPRVNAAPPDSAPTATPSGSSEPVNFRTGNSATEQIAISGSATIKPAPTQTVPSATAPVAAPTAGVPQAEADAGNNKLTGNTADNLAHNNFAPLTSNLAASNFAISNFGASNSVSSNFNASNFNSLNLGGSNLTPNLNAQAPTSASLAATAGDAAKNAKPDFSQQQPAPETTSPTTTTRQKILRCNSSKRHVHFFLRGILQHSANGPSRALRKGCLGYTHPSRSGSGSAPNPNRIQFRARAAQGPSNARLRAARGLSRTARTRRARFSGRSADECPGQRTDACRHSHEHLRIG